MKGSRKKEGNKSKVIEEFSILCGMHALMSAGLGDQSYQSL